MDTLDLEYLLDEVGSDTEDTGRDEERRYTSKLCGLNDAMERNEAEGYIEILGSRVSSAKTDADKRMYGRLLRIAHILYKKTGV